MIARYSTTMTICKKVHDYLMDRKSESGDFKVSAYLNKLILDDMKKEAENEE